MYDADARLDADRYPEVRTHLDLDSSQCEGGRQYYFVILYIECDQLYKG